MFDFVINKHVEHLECEEKIIELEKKYGIKFPDMLKIYYKKYDTEQIFLCKFSVKGINLEVAKMVPLVAKKMSFEELVTNDREDALLPNTMYPIARDRGGNYYYWDSDSEEVYIYFCDDYDNPFKVSDSIVAFFEMLDNSIKND